MFDYQKIRQEVEAYVDYSDYDFSIEGIMQDLRDRYEDLASIDDIDADEWNEILEKNDLY